MLTIEKIQVATAILGVVLGLWAGWTSVEDYMWCRGALVEPSVFYMTKSRMRAEAFRIALHLVFLFGGLIAIRIRERFPIFYIDVPILITRNVTMTTASAILMVWTGYERYDNSKIKRMRIAERLLRRRSTDKP